MTMLYSFYSREGITFAADSRITRRGSTRPEASQRKVLRVGRVGVSTGLVGYYGLAEVGRRPMANWLASLIAAWPGSRSPADFAQLLVDRLQMETSLRERREVSGLHLGAFRKAGRRIEPVFFHIVNTYGFDEATGRHTDVGDFRQEEQLMGRDVLRFGWQPGEVRMRLGQLQRQQGVPHWYRNGDLLLFGTVTTLLQVALANVAQLRGYAAPTDLPGWERVARTMVITTGQVARAYYRGRIPTIGGKAHVLSVPWPAA